MAVFHSASHLAASQSKRFHKVVRAWKVEHRTMAVGLGGWMQDQVSGGISTKELRRRGHPFGRRRGRNTLKLIGGSKGSQQRFRTTTKSKIATPLLPINYQTGKLRRSFRIIPEQGFGLQSYRLQFTAKHAKFVLRQGGTKKMVARGYWTAVRAEWKSRNRKMIYSMRLRQLQIMYGHA